MDSLMDTQNTAGTTMILGGNGFAVKAADSFAALIYDPARRQIDIRSTNRKKADIPNEPAQERVALCVEGKIYCDGVDIMSAMRTMQTMLIHQQHEIETLKSTIREIYYAPGMPGYLAAQQDFNETVEKRES